MKFRKLLPHEIEVRAQQVQENGAIALLYKDARCDMNILDESVGPLNWQRHHSRDNANCTVSIFDEVNNQWVSKEDTGTESNTQAEKGLASDSFKRACFNWGIGRELYTSPFIWLKASDVTIAKNNRGSFYLKDRLKVTAIGYDKYGVINYLVIATDKGKEVYSYGNINDVAITDEQIKQIEELLPKERINGLKKHFKIEELSELDFNNASIIITKELEKRDTRKNNDEVINQDEVIDVEVAEEVEV